MTLEIALLVLESLLLGFTIVLLVMSLKEGRSRDSLILEVSKATRVLTRHEYFLTVMDTMMEAKREIIGSITGRMPQGDDVNRSKQLVYDIEKMVQAGVKVKYLMPKFQDRLYIGWLYSQAGAEVYYSSCPHVHDFRYTIVDAKVCLIGVPEHVGEKEATKKGYRIPSEGLAEILRTSFTSCLGDSVTFEQFIRETLKQTGAEPKVLSRELNIPEPELLKITNSTKA